jgi:hypothetical protein
VRQTLDDTGAPHHRANDEVGIHTDISALGAGMPVHLGAQMGILVVTEGVEAESRRIGHQEMGTCYLQGFFIAYPVAASSLMPPHSSHV